MITAISIIIKWPLKNFLQTVYADAKVAVHADSGKEVVTLKATFLRS